jgi:hypothetical protein
MVKQTVTIIAEVAFVHKGESVIRGDRLPMSLEDALDLQALALATIVPTEEVAVATPVAAAADTEPAKPRRTASRNRYLRRDARRDEGTGT